MGSLVIQHFDAATDLSVRYNTFANVETTLDFGPNLGDFDTVTSGNIYFDSAVDGSAVIKHFNNMTVRSGHNVTVLNRCKGLYILVEGNLVLDGTISMGARGPRNAGKFVCIDPRSELIYYNSTDIFSGTPGVIVIPAKGGAGGAGAVVIQDFVPS